MRFSAFKLRRRHASFDRRFAVMLMLLVFAATGVIVTSIVLTALDRVADYANRLDEERSRETVTGAIRTFKYQLGATLNDYANWDDAAEYVYNKQDADWIVRNFGDMTFESDLFDVAILLDQHGRSVMAYSDGEPITEPIEQFVNADVRLMLDQVKSMPAGRMPQMVGFTKTAKGVAAAGIAMIRMKSSDNLEPPANPAYLVFMRHLSAQTVARVGQAYVLPGLQLTPAYITASHRVNIRSPSGYGLGALGWEPRAPGDISREQVRPLVTSATVIVGIYCLLLVLVGAKELRRVRADEAAAVRMSRTDRLSGLANREGLFVGLADRVGRARLSGEDVGLLYLDLDGFKEVNDAYGHATGDRLIRGVAAGLRTLVAEGDTIARVGGDEFAIVVSGANAEARSVSLCNSILEFLGEPFSIGERVAIIGCSIGLCVSAGGATEGEELVRRADMAMYCSKENGRGRWTSYDPRMDDEREERNRLELDLRAAIDNDEITVVYQPVVDVRDRELVSVEALARWNRAGHGLVPPDVFIPVAEASGMIDALGISVLRQACAQMRAWPELGLSVNVSPGQFRDPAFASRVAAVLADTGMNPHHLVLEMTETYFVRSPERAIQALERLRKIGVQIALDDFGAGFSSVGYLRKFGFDRMKIDRSMVSALDGGQNAVETLQATVALARSMGIPVTAEGVETEEQAVALRLAGCDELQGYLFGKPSAPEAIEDRRRRSAGRRAHTP